VNRGAALVVLAAICFATLGPTSRFAFAAGVDALTLVTWRAVIGLLFVIGAAFVLSQRGMTVFRPLGEIPRRHRALNVTAGLFNAVLNLAVLVAITRISITLALLVFYTYPAMVALVSTVFFKERLDGPRWAALLVSLVGLVLVIIGAGAVGALDVLGVSLAFVGTLCQVVCPARQARFLVGPGSPGGGVVRRGAAFSWRLAVGNLADLGSPLASSAALLPILWAGTIGAGIPTVAWIMGIRTLGAPRVSSTLEPVVGVTLAALLLQERPTPLQLAGGALIVGAAIVVQRRAGVEASDHEAVPDPAPVP
jgi:drug/metabolite transporter (DMT)-like permease